MLEFYHGGIHVVINSITEVQVKQRVVELGQSGLDNITGGRYAVSCEETDYYGSACILLENTLPTLAICLGTLSTSIEMPIAAVFSLDPDRQIGVVGSQGIKPLTNYHARTGGLDVTRLIYNVSNRLYITWEDVITINRVA